MQVLVGAAILASSCS